MGGVFRTLMPQPVTTKRQLYAVVTNTESFTDHNGSHSSLEARMYQDPTDFSLLGTFRDVQIIWPLDPDVLTIGAKHVRTPTCFDNG